MRCPKCGTSYSNDGETNFCELDGTPLVPDAEYVAPIGAPAPPGATGCICGKAEDDGSGYCTGCGMELVPPVYLSGDAADTGHVATPPDLAPAPSLGAVTDRGIRHTTNQDAVAVALETVGTTTIPVLVVCDGVSSARHSEASSVAAALAARDALVQAVHALASGKPSASAVPASPVAAIWNTVDLEAETVTDPAVITPAMIAEVDGAEQAEVRTTDAPTAASDGEAETKGYTTYLKSHVAPALADPIAAVRAAVIAAHLAICDIDDTPNGANDTLGPPGCTFVAALVEPETITVGWVGDSRAYLFTEGDARLLTRDHSYVNDLADQGQLTEEEAKAQQTQSHIITRCLGPLNGEGRTPPEASVTQIPRPPTGMLLLCTDGLWNYAPEAAHMAKLVRASGAGATAQMIARDLAEYAVTAGGHDNITVAVAILGEPLSPPALADPKRTTDGEVDG